MQKKITWKDFEAHCQMVERATHVKPNESITDRKQRIRVVKKDYAEFFSYYFPHYAKYPTAKQIKKWANAELNDPTFKGIMEAFRGFSKSTHGNLGIPLWLMINGELHFQLTVSETEKKSQMLIAGIQAELMRNQRFSNDFGQQHNHGNWADGFFVTKNNVAFAALGLGQSPLGIRNAEHRPDRITCDDVDSKERSKNPKRVRQAVEWIQDDLMGCFDIGRERFSLLNSRNSKNSILATLHKQNVLDKPKKERWYYLLANAIDNQGRSTYPEKYSDEYWKKKRESMTLRSWQKSYMNNPIEEGTVFKLDWIKWKNALPYHKYDALVAYCDPSFKNTPHSDYKAIKLWGKIGRELHLIKSFVRQCSVGTMVKWFYDLHEEITKLSPSGNVAHAAMCSYYIEANFLQDLLLDEFADEGDKRGYQLPIRADKRSKPDKFSRIESTSPLYERGFIYYNAKEKADPDMQKAVEHLLAIEQGTKTPDDSPDADEGAIWFLQRIGRATGVQPRIGKREARSPW